MWVYFAVFFLLFSFTILDVIDGLENCKVGIKIGLFILLVLFAGLCGYVSNDHLNYVIIYDDYEGLSKFFTNPEYYATAEPGIDLIISFLNLFSISTVNVFFLTFSLIAVTLKFKALPNITPFFFLSILIYFSNMYLLQEMTQIRSAIASGFLLLCIPDIVHRKKLPFLGKVFLSSLVHYSSIIILPLYFFDPRKINRGLYAALIFITIFLSFANVDMLNLLAKLPFVFISAKVEKYNEIMSMGIHLELNRFNVFILLKICLAFFLLYHVKVLQQKNEYAVVCLKIYITSIICFYFFSHIPVFAFRISELLGVVEIVMIPMLLLVIKEKTPALITIFAYAMTLIAINLLYAKLLSPYF